MNGYTRLNYMSLGSNIRHYRKAKGLKQDDLASTLGVSKSAISLYESDQNTVSPDKIIMLTQLFGITADQLLSDDTPTGSTVKSKVKGNSNAVGVKNTVVREAQSKESRHKTIILLYKIKIEILKLNNENIMDIQKKILDLVNEELGED